MAAWLGKDVKKLRNKGGKWKFLSEKEMIEMSEKYRPYRQVPKITIFTTRIMY